MKTIQEMAREAGGYISPYYPVNFVMDIHDLERFAALVREDEREACAKVCEQGEFMTFGCVAEAIRARSEK